MNANAWGKSLPDQAQSDRQFVIKGHVFDAPALSAGLYIVATPIGNLGDMTFRALETLAAADTVLCEDTRQSAKLLDHYGIRTRRQPFHEHNERERTGLILHLIAEGKAVALISDAGTPLLSDPGFPLVRAARKERLPVTALPGASALLAGLTIAGLPTDRFSFVGFLPPKSGARRNALEALATKTDTLVFYESPRRLAEAIADMAEVLGAERPAAVTLELTKKFERVHEGTLAELAESLAGEAIKGEAVVLVGGAMEGAADDEGNWHEALEEAMKEQPLRAAVDEITSAFGLKRKQVYDAALALKQAKS